MANLRIKRGNHTKVSEYLGSEGEVIYNTESKQLHVMDGVTAGGVAAASEKQFVGMIASFAADVSPTGWLVCDGSALSRSTYSILFSVIGEAWGSGDGNNTFNLPDLRGEFLRGVDNGAGQDPDATSRSGGDAVGSSQNSMYQSHGHNIRGGSGGIPDWFGGSGASYGMLTGGGSAYGGYVQNAGGNETRPRNKAVQFCIKY